MKITLAIMMASLLVMSSFVVPMNHAFALDDTQLPQSASSVDISLNKNWQDPDRKSTRLNSSHSQQSRMPSSA